MLIDSVIKNESIRNKKMIIQYETLIKELPKGSITCRKQRYYYLRYRENGKLFDIYIGNDTKKADEIREKLATRKHYVEMLAALKREEKTINKILEDLK